MTMVTHPVSSLQVCRCALAMSCRTRKSTANMTEAIDSKLCRHGSQTVNTELCSSITAVFTLDRSFNLDNNNLMSLGKDGEHHPECRKVPDPRLNIELYWQEVDIVFVGRGFLPMPQQIFANT